MNIISRHYLYRGDEFLIPGNKPLYSNKYKDKKLDKRVSNNPNTEYY